MLKLSTRPRKKKVDDGSINALFSGAADPTLDTDLQAEALKGKDPEPNAALLAQIAALEHRLDDMAKISAASLTAAPQVPSFGKEPVLDLSGLPDAQYDNEAFTAALAKRTQDHVKATMEYQNRVADASRQETQSANSKAETLWNDFQAKFPDHSAASEKLVLFASQQVADAAKARGLDVEKYMFNNRTQFMTEVAAAMDDIRGTPFGKDPGQEEEEPANEEAATRTMGVFGNGTSIPPAKGSQEKTLAGDMISEIHDIQRKSGFF